MFLAKSPNVESIIKKCCSYSMRGARFVPEFRMPIPRTEKRLDIVIIGSPNSGKSVLLNQLVKSKLAATSRKRHTTRGEILGVFNHRNIQLAFYDTPGFVRSAEALRQEIRSLRDIATTSMTKADVVLLVVDSSYDVNTRYKDAFAEMVRVALDYAKLEIILVLNKVDLVKPKDKLLQLTFDLVSLINGVKLGPDGAEKAVLDTTTFMISALKNDGVIDLKNYLLSSALFKPWIIPKEKKKITNMTMEERVNEVILEKMLDNTHDEIPYIAEIICTSIKNLSSSRAKIDVDILVDSPAQQRIVVGHQGRTLVKIRQSAAEELEKILNTQIILYLWIKQRGKHNETKLDSVEEVSS